MKIWFPTSILLFISAYSPLMLILAVKDWDFERTNYFKHPITIFIILGLAIFSILLLFWSFSRLKRGNMPVTIISVKNRSADLINYTIPYIVSFFSFDLSKMEDVISLLIFLILMFVLTLKSKSVFLNPILLCKGYNLYDIEYSFDGNKSSQILLSKDEPCPNDKFYIRSLTRFFYITTKKINTNDAEN